MKKLLTLVTIMTIFVSFVSCSSPVKVTQNELLFSYECSRLTGDIEPIGSSWKSGDIIEVIADDYLPFKIFDWYNLYSGEIHNGQLIVRCNYEKTTGLENVGYEYKIHIPTENKTPLLKITNKSTSEVKIIYNTDEGEI